MSPPAPSRSIRRFGLSVLAALALTTGTLAAATAAPANAASAAPVKHVCATAARGHASCLSMMRTDVAGRRGVQPKAAVSGLGPSDLQSAYALPSSSAGAGQTVAIVDAFDDPNAESDLGTYRSQFGLPSCTTANGCFRKVNQRGSTTGLPTADSGWAGEISLDVDMVSATCPQCHILLVETDDNSINNLGAGDNEAVTLGAKYVSNSYGGSEDPTETSADAFYNHPGVAVTASSGDSGYGVEYPAASPYVTAVSGTSLTRSSNTRGWNETAWSGGGSGCSAYEPKPTWQKDTGCTRRTVPDVSAVADPNTGVAVYDSFQETGWNVFGGTSAASPIVASVYALAGPPAAGTVPASYPYAHTSALNDITSGSNGSCSPAYLCQAGPGYDGPTGLGTPNGVTAFSSGSSGGGSVSVTNPGDQTSTVGTAVSLQVNASDSTSGQTLTYSATGLPAGLSINSSTGLISGTPTTAGSPQVTVTATDGTGASDSATFTWTVNPVGGGCASPGDKVSNGGFESGTTPWTLSSGVRQPTGSGESPHSGSWFAWLDGYGTTHTDTATQSVAIPAGCTAQLSLWLHIDTDESGSTAYDRLTVKIGSTTLGTYSNVNATSGYTQKTFDVSAFAGQTVTLSFTGTEDSLLQTSFVVDDVAVNAS